MPLQIDQDGAKYLAFAQREVIDTQYPWCAAGWKWRTACETQQGGRADRHPLPQRQTSAGFTTNIDGQSLLFALETCGTPCLHSHEIGQAFAKSVARTPRIVAKEAPDMECYFGRPLEHGQISHGAVVAAMHARGRSLTGWARHCWCRRGQLNRDLISSD